MTARSTLLRIHARLFHLLTGMLLLVAVVTADCPKPVKTALTKTYASASDYLSSKPLATGDEELLSIANEFHPEAGIGPPTRKLIRTALKPEVGADTGYANPGQAWGNAGQNDSAPGSNGRGLGGQGFGGNVRRLWGNESGYPNVAPQPTAAPQEDLRADKIAARSQDSRMVGFLQTASFNQIASLFVEASRMIDTRHVNPPSYEVRTASALSDLAYAVSTPEFLQANRVNPAPQAISALQQELMQMSQTQPARSSNEALGVMQWAAELTSQRLGVRREAAALEFLNGMLDSLDRYSAFIPAKTQVGPSASLEERIVGIGVELKVDPRGALITDTIENGPARAAGLQKGDVIVGIEGRGIAGMSLGQSADLIGGPQGTAVTLQVDRQSQAFRVQVPRKSVYISSVVDPKFLDSKRQVGYLKVKQFSESTAEDLIKEMTRLNDAGMDSLVLDLRGNPGGLLTECVDVSDIFLPGGTIVMTKGRNEGDNSNYQAKRPNTWSIPLVVLVDDHSASASEIFAAAVQENGRGVIVGRKSYGKGTVQTHFPLQSVNGELKLTTAKFYSPMGREMAGQGVTPDVPVEKAPGAMETDETRDLDLLTALRVVQSGRAAQLAQAAGQTGQTNRNLGSLFGR